MFAGSMVALVTPMMADGSLDLAAWDRLLDFHAANGTDGVVVAGTTGESPTLDDSELRTLVAVAVRRLKGRMPVIVGAGVNSTALAVERARDLSGSGADALLVVTPQYNKPPQRGLYEHFRSIAAASRLPVI